MKPYTVLHISRNDPYTATPRSVVLQAEDDDHAKSQVLSAHHDRRVVWVAQGDDIESALWSYHEHEEL